MVDDGVLMVEISSMIEGGNFEFFIIVRII